MDEKQFILDLWDVIRDNGYCTIEEFRKKYAELFYDTLNENDTHGLCLGDHNSDWVLSIKKVWARESVNQEG